MEKKIVLEQYKQYLNLASADSGNGIPSLFKKIRDFLLKYADSVPTPFWNVIYLHCIRVTVSMISKKKVFLKGLSSNWSQDTVKEYGRLQGLVEKCLFEEDEDGLKDSYNHLKSLVETCDDVCVQLYLNKCFLNSKYGKIVKQKAEKFDNIVAALLQLSTEEEIDEYLGITSTEESTEEKVEEEYESTYDSKEHLKEFIAEYLKYLNLLKSGEHSMSEYSELKDEISNLHIPYLKPHMELDAYINLLRANHRKLSSIEPSSQLKIFIDSNCEDVDRLMTALTVTVDGSNREFSDEKNKIPRIGWLPTLYRYFRPTNQQELEVMFEELEDLRNYGLITVGDYICVRDCLKICERNKRFFKDEVETEQNVQLSEIEDVVRVFEYA